MNDEIDFSWTPLDYDSREKLFNSGSERSASMSTRSISKKDVPEAHKGSDRSLLDDDVQDFYLKQLG